MSWKDKTLLTFEQIKELIELVADRHISGVELERAGFRLKVDGYRSAETVQVAAPVPMAAAPAPLAPAAAPAAAPAPAPETAAPAPAAAPEPEAAEPSAAEEGELPAGSQIITSPIVGTFYRSPNPEAPSFVEVGAQVKKGQVLCIVEAMKLMNEIESDLDGEIVAIFPENAQPVEFGERLFAVKPA